MSKPRPGNHGGFLLGRTGGQPTTPPDPPDIDEMIRPCWKCQGDGFVKKRGLDGKLVLPLAYTNCAACDGSGLEAGAERGEW